MKRLFDNMEFLAKEKNKPDLNDCRKTFEIFKKFNGWRGNVHSNNSEIFVKFINKLT